MVNIIKVQALVNIIKVQALVNMIKVQALVNMIKFQALVNMIKVQALVNMIKFQALVNMIKFQALVNMIKFQTLVVGDIGTSRVTIWPMSQTWVIFSSPWLPAAGRGPGMKSWYRLSQAGSTGRARAPTCCGV
jgi:hypothetical protein